jgi:hypothetical protein
MARPRSRNLGLMLLVVLRLSVLLVAPDMMARANIKSHLSSLPTTLAPHRTGMLLLLVLLTGTTLLALGVTTCTSHLAAGSLAEKTPRYPECFW